MAPQDKNTRKPGKGSASPNRRVNVQNLTPQQRKRLLERRRRRRRQKMIRRIAVLAALALLVILLIFGIVKLIGFIVSPKKDNSSQIVTQIDESGGDAETAEDQESASAEENGEGTGEETQESTEDIRFLKDEEEAAFNTAGFNPHAVESTKPSNYIEYTGIMVDGEELSSTSDYSNAADLSFGPGLNYQGDIEGIITFRGNNFRNNPTYGLANMTEYKLQTVWDQTTDGLSYNNSTWTGSGWTGQPLIVKWPASTKAFMNMEEWAKQDDELVEVIYACMDGYIYFMDLKTGKPTREKMYLGFTFKGAGALDPRGYPIMYVGSGYDSYEGTSRVFIINLLDCSVMYTFGNNDEFSLRGALSYFDASALVNVANDTLIYPGENGILYLMKLNTVYDEAAGKLSINPSDIRKWHYWGVRSDSSQFWLGMEDSPAIFSHYLYVSDNGGNLMCIDINTLQLVWVQDSLDDSNSTPVLSVEDGKLYLYTSTSFRLGWRGYDTATIPIWKIDAETGEIIWQQDYTCFTDDGVSGGVQSTIAQGKFGLKDYIYVTVSKTNSQYGGVLACINKKTGEKAWEHSASYAWSSPVCVYNSDGSGKVIYCDASGNMYLLDGITGDVLDTISLSEGVIEASPAVYENMAVVGTRDCKIWGIELK